MIPEGEMQGLPSAECEQPLVVHTGSACGNEVVRLKHQKPTIYFVLDVSGSMSDRVLDRRATKLEAAQAALIDVAGEIGHRAKYGLTVFPGDDTNLTEAMTTGATPLFGCAPGDEVFSVQEGDPVVCLNRKPAGPILRKFSRVVNEAKPRGGTPLSPTLDAITPSLLSQDGVAAVVLVTDGSPNCNPEAVCKIDDCQPNRSGDILQTTGNRQIACDAEFNCCDVDLVGDIVSYPAAGCVDVDASEEKLELLRNAGVDTYVIGVLGLSDFDNVMNRLAVAGGQPRPGRRAYYDVESLEELSDTVRAIGLTLTQQCDIRLTDRPAFSNELNVYFDAEVVPFDSENGWSIEDDLVTLNGSSCDTLQSGRVTEVQMVSGCETILR